MARYCFTIDSYIRKYRYRLVGKCCVNILGRNFSLFKNQLKKPLTVMIKGQKWGLSMTVLLLCARKSDFLNLEL